MTFSILIRRISRKSVVGPCRWISQKYPNDLILSDSSCGAGITTMSFSEDSAHCSSTSPSRTSSPWLMLPPAFEGSDMVYNFYSLAENKILSFNKRGGGKKESTDQELPDDDAEFLGSSHGWLALFNQRNNDLFLSNPLSRHHIKLPPIDALPNPEMNLRDGHGSVSKVIISCSPDDEEEECIAMMSFGPGDRLAFCLPSHSTEWTPIGDLFHDYFMHPDINYARVYEDFVYSSRRKLFTCITQVHDVEWFDMEDWDLGDPRSPRIDWSTRLQEHDLNFACEECSWSKQNKQLSEYCWQIPYLVFAEQSDQLFLVVRFIKSQRDSYPYKTVGFDVHKIDRDQEGETRYMKAASLDGLVMFIGINHSFTMSAAEFPELKPNSIYFTDAKQLNWDSTMPYGGHDIGIFDYENWTLSPCFYPCDSQSIKRIVPPPMWFTPSPH